MTLFYLLGKVYKITIPLEQSLLESYFHVSLNWISTMNDTLASDVYFIHCAKTIHRVPIGGIYLYNIYGHFVFCLLVFVPSTFLNFFLAIAVLRKRTLKTLPYILIVNVLIQNITISIAICVWCGNFYLATRGAQNCNLYTGTACLGYGLSLVGFCEIWLLSIERYIAIFKPWFYEEKKSAIKKTFLWLILFSWVLSIIAGGLGSLSPQFNVMKYMISFTVPLSIVCLVFIHLRIYYTTSMALKKIRKFSVGQYANINQEEKTTNANVLVNAQNRKLAIVTACILVQIVIFYLPFSLVALYKQFVKASDNNISVLFIWSVTAAALKGFTTPLLFLYQMSAMRVSLKEFCTKKYIP